MDNEEDIIRRARELRAARPPRKQPVVTKKTVVTEVLDKSKKGMVDKALAKYKPKEEALGSLLMKNKDRMRKPDHLLNPNIPFPKPWKNNTVFLKKLGKPGQAIALGIGAIEAIKSFSE